MKVIGLLFSVLLLAARNLLTDNLLFVICNTLSIVLFVYFVNDLLAKGCKKFIKIQKIDHLFWLAILFGFGNMLLMRFLGGFITLTNYDNDIFLSIALFMIDIFGHAIYWVNFYCLAKAYGLIADNDMNQHIAMIEADKHLYNMYLKLSIKKKSTALKIMFALMVSSWCIVNYSAFTNLFGWLFFGFFMIMINVLSFSVIWLNFDNDNFANEIIVKSYDVLSKTEADGVCDYVEDNKVEICISYLLSQRTSFVSNEKEITMPFAKRDVIWLILNTGLILLAGMGLRVFEMYYSLLIASNQAVFDLTTTWIISEAAVLGSVYLSTYLGYKGIITINKIYGILVIAPIVIRMLAFLF